MYDVYFVITGKLKTLTFWSSVKQLEWNSNSDTVFKGFVCLYVLQLQQQQVMLPLQSSVPAANVLSSRSVEQYPPASDAYWKRMGSDHSYLGSHSQTPTSRYRS